MNILLHGYILGIACTPLLLKFQSLHHVGKRKLRLVAHTSTQAHIRKAVDPEDEYDLLQTIIKGLETIDEEFDYLVDASTPP